MESLPQGAASGKGTKHTRDYEQVRWGQNAERVRVWGELPRNG